MNLVRSIRTYASLLIAIVLVVLTLLPPEFNLPRFFLFVGLALLVLKDLADIRSMLAETLIETRSGQKGWEKRENRKDDKTFEEVRPPEWPKTLPRYRKD